MKIACVSDTHGHLPDIPKCDLLLIGGDVCPVFNHDCGFQAMWLETTFKSWIESIDAKYKVLVFGNHDFIGEKFPAEIKKIFRKFPKNFKYLEDSGVEFQDLNIWGSPHQPRFYDWAFNLDEPDLKKKWDLIPKNTDILLLHGPPHGYGDKASRIIKDKNEEEWPGFEHTGSLSLLEKIKEIKPKLVVAGHIHSGYGQYDIEGSIFINASLVNERYQPVHSIFIIEI